MVFNSANCGMHDQWIRCFWVRGQQTRHARKTSMYDSCCFMTYRTFRWSLSLISVSIATAPGFLVRGNHRHGKDWGVGVRLKLWDVKFSAHWGVGVRLRLWDVKFSAHVRFPGSGPLPFILKAVSHSEEGKYHSMRATVSLQRSNQYIRRKETFADVSWAVVWCYACSLRCCIPVRTSEGISMWQKCLSNNAVRQPQCNAFLYKSWLWSRWLFIATEHTNQDTSIAKWPW